MPNNPITGVTPYEVFRISFWMKKFGHATLKRTTVVSNSRAIYAFDQGPLTSEEKHCMSQLKPMWMLREGSAGKVHPFSNKHSFLAKRCFETIFPVPKIQQFMFTKELFPPALKQNKFQWLLGEWTSAQGVSTSFCSCCCPSTA